MLWLVDVDGPSCSELIEQNHQQSHARHHNYMANCGSLYYICVSLHGARCTNYMCRPQWAPSGYQWALPIALNGPSLGLSLGPPYGPQWALLRALNGLPLGLSMEPPLAPQWATRCALNGRSPEPSMGLPLGPSRSLPWALNGICLGPQWATLWALKGLL